MRRQAGQSGDSLELGGPAIVTGNTLDTRSCIFSYDDDFVTHLKPRALKGAGWVMVGNLGGVVHSVFTLLLARLLAPHDFGLLGMSMVLVGLAGVFRGPGLHSAIIQRKDLTIRELSSVFWVNVSVGLVLALVVAGASPLIAAFYGQPMVMSLLLLLSLDMLVRSSFLVPDALLRRKLRFQVLALIYIGANVASGSVAVCLAFLGFGVWALVGRILVHSVLVAAAYWLLAGWRPSAHFRLSEAWPLVLFGLPLLGVTILTCFQNQFGPLLIGKVLGPTALGYYAMAYTVAMLPAVHCSQPLASLALPVFSCLQDDQRRLARHYLTLLKAVAAAVFPAMMGLAILAPYVVSVVLGKKWLPAVSLLQILCTVGALQALYATSPSVFRSQGRPGLELLTRFLLVLAIVASFVTGLRWGVTGLCTAYGICMCFVTPLVIRAAAGLLGIGLRDVLHTIWAPVAGALLVGGAVGGFRMLHESGLLKLSEPLFLTVAVVLGIVVYAGAMSLLAARDLIPLVRQAIDTFLSRTAEDTASK